MGRSGSKQVSRMASISRLEAKEELAETGGAILGLVPSGQLLDMFSGRANKTGR